MFCRLCGSEIPNNAIICPNCGEVLKSEEEIVPEIERIALEKGITKELFVFFSQNVGSAFSKDALLNRLEEIITDRKAREYSSQHLQKLLYKMVQKGSITSNLHNNETHYHISDAHQEGPHKAINGFIDVLKKKEKSPIVTRSSIRASIRAPKTSPTAGNATAAFVIIALIGVILFIAGLVITIGGGTSGSTFTLGISLTIIGFLICFLFIGIATNGECFYCLCEGMCPVTEKKTRK